MNLTRRQFVQTSAIAAAGLLVDRHATHAQSHTNVKIKKIEA
ncbi:MAG: twin-arginine translocation signal domain-containing protein, partial [Limisphaerales bacterium]